VCASVLMGAEKELLFGMLHMNASVSVRFESEPSNWRIRFLTTLVLVQVSLTMQPFSLRLVLDSMKEISASMPLRSVVTAPIESDDTSTSCSSHLHRTFDL
jgi:hypothetical protein